MALLMFTTMETQSQLPVATMRALGLHGFEFVGTARMREELKSAGSVADWERFAASWNSLELDVHMADHGRYRRRRHAVYAIAPDRGTTRAAHQPHFQSREYNALNGGIERWFAPIEMDIGASQTMSTLLEYCRVLFGSLRPTVSEWHVEVHQFRIEALAGRAGLPTPEGVHRDGVDLVLVLLIARHNIECGTTTIHTPAGELLGSFTLTSPFDAALVDDTRVCHGVTAVEASDPTQVSYRDVLVITFKASQKTA
ncbi:MAG: 2OG-Fe dioxygenase family protein [Tahibacter sp.]